jgi:cGMP-dependent protein kinase
MGCASSSASSPPLRTKGGNPDEVAALTTKLRTRGKNVFAEPIDKDWQPVVHPKSDASKQIIRTALKNNTFSALFEEMKESELFRFIDLMCPERQSPGVMLITQGTAGEYMYVLEKGEVSYRVDNKTLGGGKDGVSFGELALLFGSPRAADVVTVTECILWKIDRTSFRACMAYTARMVEKKQGGAAFGRSDANVKGTWPQRKNIPFSSLSTVANLGAGQFGQVTLVKCEEDRAVYVLKAISKRKVEDQNSQASVLREKDTMIACDHPFVCKLHATWRGTSEIYFLVDFAQGGDLWTRLFDARDAADGLKPNDVRFYAAGVVMAMGHVHSKGIIYRDIKPENLMIDDKGYIKLIDFGFAKFMNASKTYTLCGTPEYMAPEIILGRGYGYSIDWWAIGVLIYEMTVGYSPFSDPDGDGDPAEVWGDIIKGALNFNPVEWKGKGLAKNLVKALLTQDDKKRLGSTGGGEAAVKKHRYFKNEDWSRLFHFEVPAPWVPTVKGPEDVAHFEDIEFEEEPRGTTASSEPTWAIEFGEPTGGGDGAPSNDTPVGALLSFFSFG